MVAYKKRNSIPCKPQIGVYPKPKFYLFERNIILLFKLTHREVRLLKAFLQHTETLIKNHGIRHAIGILKEEFRIVIKLFLGQTNKTQVGPSWISVNKTGIPSYLNFTRAESRLLLADLRLQKITLTILNGYKLLFLEPDYDISTIVEPCKVTPKHLISYIEKVASEQFLAKLFSGYRIEPMEPFNGNPIYVTTKAGASGPKTMGITSLIDYHNIQKDGTLDLIKELMPLVFTREPLKLIENLLNQTSSTPIPNCEQKHKVATSRLHFLSEGGGKTRVICIADIWTQITLRPIHKYLMDCLKKFKNDGTASHNRVAQICRKITETSGMYCFDLKAATDRMPLLLQVAVLKPLLGDTVTDLWSRIMKRKVLFRDESYVEYSVGQPMGLLSSWAAMALTHHVIVNYCYDTLKYSKFQRDYVVIGDDIAIKECDVAQMYRKLLEEFGMEVAYAKSIIPSSENLVCEIAKRYFTQGYEISPITPEQICFATNSLEDLLALDRTLEDRSYYRLNKTEPTALIRYTAPGFLGREDSIASLLLHIKKADKLQAYIYLSSPLAQLLEPMSPNISLGASANPLLTKVRLLLWDQSILFNFMSDFERFLLETVADKIIKFESRISPTPKPDIAEHMNTTSALEILSSTPIIDEYYKISIKEMKAIFQIYNQTFIDEEGDTDEILDATNPTYVLNELYARPDPLDKSPFFKGGDEKVRFRSSVLMNFLKSKGINTQMIKDLL